MLIFIKLTVIFQLTKIQNFLADYAVELASTDFDKIYSKNGAVQYEDYTVVYHPGTFHANSFRKLCINDYTTPFRVTKDMNLTDIFTTYSIQEAWVDLYQSKVSGLLLDKTDYPPVTLTIDADIDATRVHTPAAGSIPNNVLETHYVLGSTRASIVPSNGKIMSFFYKPVYNTSIDSVADALTSIIRHMSSIMCLKANQYPNTPKTKKALEDLVNLMLDQVNKEVALFKALITEWRFKENAIPIAVPNNYTVNMSLDVDDVVRENLIACRRQKENLKQGFRFITNPIDLALLMFEHELLLAEIKSIRQDILTPLTNPLSLIDLNNLDEQSGTNPTLLKHESLSGFYLQVERRLGYIIPAQGESKINSFGRANPFYKITLMDYLTLGISVFLALGFLVQCSMVTANTIMRWRTERDERIRDQEWYRFRVNRIERSQPPIRETVLPTCENCSEKREMYRTRPPSKVIKRYHRNKGHIPSHLRVSKLDINQ
jgi:hypothetical protein